MWQFAHPSCVTSHLTQGALQVTTLKGMLQVTTLKAHYKPPHQRRTSRHNQSALQSTTLKVHYKSPHSSHVISLHAQGTLQVAIPRAHFRYRVCPPKPRCKSWKRHSQGTLYWGKTTLIWVSNTKAITDKVDHICPKKSSKISSRRCHNSSSRARRTKLRSGGLLLYNFYGLGRG